MVVKPYVKVLSLGLASVRDAVSAHVGAVLVQRMLMQQRWPAQQHGFPLPVVLGPQARMMLVAQLASYWQLVLPLVLPL